MSCAAAPWQTRPRVEHQMHGRSRVGCWTGLEAPTPLPQPLCEDWSDQRLPQCGWPHVQARGCEAMDESTRWHAQTCPSIRAAGASTRRARSSTLLSPSFAAPCGQPYPHTQAEDSSVSTTECLNSRISRPFDFWHTSLTQPDPPRP